MKAEHTKKLLVDTIKDCVNDIPLSKISVKILCDRSQVSRATFYYHFQDIQDLVCYTYYYDCVSIAKNCILQGDFVTGEDAALRQMFKYKDFYIQALKDHGQNSLHNYIFEQYHLLYLLLFEMRCKIKNQRVKEEFSNEIDNLLKFYSQANCNFVIDWIENGMKIPVEKLNYILNIVSFTVIEAFNSFTETID